MHASLKAALQGDGATILDAVKMEYPGGDYRLISGGFATIGGEAYEAAGDVLLSSVEEYSDGGDGTAPRCRIVVLPSSASVMADLVAPAAQWSRVYCYWGAVNPETGALIGEAEQPFIGYVDVVDVEITEAGWRLIIDCASALDQALDMGEGQRLSNPFHQRKWPGELGFDGVTGLTETVWWGTRPPAGTTNGSSGGGGPISRWVGGDTALV